MTRQFNSSQRVDLYVQAAGHCEECGAKLEPGWHADHKIPYSAGGPTQLWNGQALCPKCNLQKGTNYKMRIPEWIKLLRNWQKEVYGAWFDHGKPNFLMVGTPGCGKTIATLKIVHSALQSGRIERVIVVVPSVHLCEQWADAANSVGIHLDAKFENSTGAIAPDMHGIIVTYQQVASQPELFRLLASQSPTGVVLDEVHHCATDKSWGDGIRVFHNTVFQLLTSGTPWRSDNYAIPYVTYERDNGYLKSIASYTYSYLRAVRDEVCRHVIFPAYEGRMEWLKGGTYYESTFEEELSEDEARDRLRTAISFCIDQSWVKEIVQKAYEHLIELRENGHPDAAMLVTVKDREEAEKAAEFFKHKLGVTPVVVHYDDSSAHENIKAFSKSSKPVLIAIKMVSEGVDIPRLRIGVYATNILTELYVWQFIGRFLRIIDDLDEQTAFVYFPRDPYFVKILKEIQQERDHVLKDIVRQVRWCSQCGHEFHWGRCTAYDEGKDDFCHCDYVPESGKESFLPIASEKRDGVMIFQSQEYNDQKLIEARRLMDEMALSPSQYTPTMIAAIMDKIVKRKQQDEIAIPEIETVRRDTRKRQLRRTAHTLVNRVVYALGDERVSQKIINGIYKNLISVRNTPEMTEEQLEAKVRVLNMLLDEIGSSGAAYGPKDISNMMAIYLERLHAS